MFAALLWDGAAAVYVADSGIGRSRIVPLISASVRVDHGGDLGQLTADHAARRLGADLPVAISLLMERPG